jgi:HEAT repeat protein
VPTEEEIQEYRRSLAVHSPAFILPRRFVAEESWTKAASAGGARYLGVLREYEPDLPGILVHKQLIILGEPGAGKSTTTRAIVQQVLNSETALPVFASLKSYDGNLRALLLRNTPASVLDATPLAKTYVFDGIDEVPSTHRDALRQELNTLLTTGGATRMVLTSRQAFHANHPRAFPDGFTAFHLLDFDDHDVRSCARHHEVNADAFIAAVRQADCQEEVHNPLVLNAMLKRYKADGSLSPLRSDNVGYVVDELIRSRTHINALRQRRALKMLATTCETAARNELTDEEALRVLQEAIEMPPRAAEQLLEELSHSILIRTPGRISFQMRSYGEYLAAEELHDKPIERVKELAFLNNAPVDTWLNAITYLAEMNDHVRQYFACHHPSWLVNVSPAALTEAERTTLARQLLQEVNQRKAYIIDEKAISLRRLAYVLTPEVIAELEAQLTSTQPHEEANALILLGILRRQDIVPQALQRAIEHRNAGSLRYSAIVALINTGNSTVVNDLITFAQTGDTYYIQIIDAIGSLCTPADFPHVLPLLDKTNAGLSSAFYHFRELTTKEALTAATDYLTVNPATLNGFGLDSYLEPLIELIPEFWGNDIATALGLLLASLERAHFHSGKIAGRIFKHLHALDHDAIAIQTMIGSLKTQGTPLRSINHLIAGLITPHAAQWIVANAPTYGEDVALWLPNGPARDVLAPQSPQAIAAQEQARAQYLAAEQQREQAITTTREQHQTTIRTARNIGVIIDACVRLQTEHWPEVSQEQRDWLATNVNQTLEQLDLANSIAWTAQNQWTHPSWLDPLLHLTDFYNLRLTNDTTIVLALRSWSDKAITNYYKKHGFTQAAQEALVNLLRTAEHDSIIRNVFSFLREANYDTPPNRELLTAIARDTQRAPEFRSDALSLISTVDATDTLLLLATDQTPGIRELAFRALIKLQHRATISRALGRLTDNDLQNGEVPFPNSSPLDWIGTITIPDVVPELRTLRKRTLDLNLWRIATVVTGTIASIDKARAAAIIKEQLPQTPEGWRTYARQEADKLARAARIEAVQQTPFDQIIKKLKGATSMIRIRVWCEGSTDRPIVRQLLREIGEEEIAQSIALIGGWGNLMGEREPEQYLNGCREAIIIMDGDNGRHLRRPKKPYTAEAKEIFRRFKEHPLTFYVLQRYGIENYFPKNACETVLQRDLTAYFPIPYHAKAEDHFCDPKPYWPRWLNRFRKKRPVSFYRKELNEQVAKHLTMTDVEGTDLATIIQAINQQAETARQY